MIWKGLGFLVVIFAFAGLLVTQVAVNAWAGNDQYYQTHGWPKLAGGLVAAIPVWFAGRYLNRRPGRTVIDAATGETLVLRSTHEFFFIRMEYWAGILLAVGLYFALAGR